MRRLLLILATLAAVLAFGPAAVAQTAPEEAAAESIDDRIARWTRVLDRVSGQLGDEDLPPAALNQLESTVKQVLGQKTKLRAQVDKRVAEVRALIEALGPPPEAGDLPESEEIASERHALKERLAVPESRLKRLDLLIQRSDLLLNEIAIAERGVLEDTLLVRTPSLLSAKTWTEAGAEFSKIVNRVAAAPERWYKSPEITERVGTGYFGGVLVATLAAAGLGWLVRRRLLRIFGRDPDVREPSFRMRVLAALSDAIGYALIPALIVLIPYGALMSRGLLFRGFGDLVLGIVTAVVVFFAITGLSRTMLSPRMPQWRLAPFGDRAARLAHRRFVLFGAFVSVDTLVILAVWNLKPEPALITSYTFIADSFNSLIILLLAVDNRLWRTPEDEARIAAARAGEPPGPPLEHTGLRSRWWLVLRVVFSLLAVSCPIIALAGYGELATFISVRLIATVGVVAIALILHGFARDLAAVLTGEEGRPEGPREGTSAIYVWSVLLLDTGLFFAAIFAMVPLWGGQWDSIFDRIARVFSGFRIGDRVFSLTDLLLGIALFIVLVVLVRFLQRFLDERLLKPTRLDVGIRHALRAGIGYVGVILAALLAIHTAGIDLSALALIAGALSVGIGFGLQGVVNNFVSGLILLAERPIKVGDWVVVGQHEGFVKRISVRSTEIETFSRASVIIPNADMVSQAVTNWMHKDVSGRVEIQVGVAYGTDENLVRDVLLKCATENEEVKKWPEPSVLLSDFGDNAVIFELRCHLKKIDKMIKTRSDMRFAIYRAFREAGITIPFPQRDLHVKDVGALAGLSGGQAEPRPASARVESWRPRAARGARGSDGDD
ncbi:MAG: DUF3772 domain-containing protein [Alphaproteobacteria bacterium]|nr:DUF3772 domain-containing protein [Alphaproteobacteria bacterium]